MPAERPKSNSIHSKPKNGYAAAKTLDNIRSTRPQHLSEKLGSYVNTKYAAAGRQSTMKPNAVMDKPSDKVDNMFAQIKSQKSFGEPILATS